MGPSSPIISPEELLREFGREGLVVLNATLPKASARGAHEELEQILGARTIPMRGAFRDESSPLPNTLPSSSQLQRAIAALGLFVDSAVVVYDEHGLYSSPRAWWLLSAMGIKNVRVLDGGLPAWRAIDGPIEKKSDTAKIDRAKIDRAKIDRAKLDRVVTASAFDGSLDMTRFWTAAQVAARERSVALFDARPAPRFRGEAPEPRAGLPSGHIPGSLCLPYASLLKDGRLLPRDERLRMLSELIPDGSEELVFTCGSGVTACILALVAADAGYENLRIYDGSWTEWASSGRAIAESTHDTNH